MKVGCLALPVPNCLLKTPKEWSKRQFYIGYRHRKVFSGLVIDVIELSVRR